MDLSKVVGKMQVRIVWCSYWLFLLTKLGEPAKLLSEEVVAVYNATVDCRGGLLLARGLPTSRMNMWAAVMDAALVFGPPKLLM